MTACGDSSPAFSTDDGTKRHQRSRTIISRSHTSTCSSTSPHRQAGVAAAAAAWSTAVLLIAMSIVALPQTSAASASRNPSRCVPARVATTTPGFAAVGGRNPIDRFASKLPTMTTTTTKLVPKSYSTLRPGTGSPRKQPNGMFFSRHDAVDLAAGGPEGGKFTTARRNNPSILLATPSSRTTESEDSATTSGGGEEESSIASTREEEENRNNGSYDDGDDDDGTTSSVDAYGEAAKAVADWTTATSIGTFLLQRQKEEEDLLVIEKEVGRAGAGAAVEIIDETDVRGVVGKKRIMERGEQNKQRQVAVEPVEKRERPFQIDEDQARQVDDSVNPLTADSLEAIMKDIKVLPMTETMAVPSRATTTSSTTSDPDDEPDDSFSSTENVEMRTAVAGKKDLLHKFFPGKGRAAEKSLPLSNPDHYGDRIDRDMRHLAVSISSSLDFAWQWRLFCDEGGGLYPLIRCIRDGARSFQDDGSSTVDTDDDDDTIGGLTERREEAFAAACAACRNLRDLCAISPELSAVVTDGVLRADAALSMSTPNADSGQECLSGGLLSDLITILRHANEAGDVYSIGQQGQGRSSKGRRKTSRKSQREARSRCRLYIMQLLLAMAVASDAAVNTMRATSELTDTVVSCSSYAPKERRRRWIRYPLEVVKRRVFSSRRSHGATASESENEGSQRPFIAAGSVGSGLDGEIQRTANMLLAAIGHNVWVPKIPGQKGLRILCLDGGGSRGIAAITSLRSIVDAMGGLEVADSFDMIVGTSTGAIIAFLVALRRETSGQAKKRYDKLIPRIFVKSALSTPMLVFTTAAYDEKHFNEVMSEILGDTSMLESRADPAVPLVFCISSKMSSNPIQISLFRNYNYGGGELTDSFTIDPEKARMELGLKADDDIMAKLSDWQELGQVSNACAPRISEGSRHSGSFRILQRAALRATTAAPTFFKPVMMGGELYSDGGIVASNPTAVAIHEARTLFPDVPIEMVVSCGTGGFIEEKTPPKIGWDGIIGQIVNSATDGEQIHHILEDILGEGGTAQLGKSSVSTTRYYRLNPVVGSQDQFPIDVIDPNKLEQLADITNAYLKEPEQQRKLKEISDVLEGKQGLRRYLRL